MKCVFSQKMKQAQAKVTSSIFVGEKLSKRLKQLPTALSYLAINYEARFNI